MALTGIELVCGNLVSAGLVHAIPESIMETGMVFAPNLIMDIKTVGVIGAGTMGNGIAHVFAKGGYNVVLVDVEQRPIAGAHRGHN